MQQIKYIFFLFCFIQFGSKVNAQTDQLIKKAWSISEQKLDSAIILCKVAYQISKERGNFKDMARAMTQRATFYDTEGKADSSLFLFQKAIDIQVAIKDTLSLIDTYRYLGNFHFIRYHMKLAEKYYKMSYEKAMEIKILIKAAAALVSLGSVETDKGMNNNWVNNKTLKYFEEAENIYIELNDSSLLPPVWANCAVYYYVKTDFKEALKWAQKSISCSTSTKNNYSKVSERILIAAILLEMKRYTEAEKYMLEALSFAENSHIPERRQYVYQTLAQIYYQQNNYKKAYNFMDRYINLRDSTINEKTIQQIANIEAMYGIEKKINEINRLKIEAEENEITALKKEKIQNTYYFILIASAIGIIILIVLVFLLMNNLKLAKINSKLSIEREKHAEALLEKEKLLMRESHHRIKNNLQLINSILDLQSRNIKDPTIKDVFIESMQRIQAISFAHQRLYGNETVETLDVNGFLSDLINSIRFSSMDNSSNIEIVQDIAKIVVSTEKAIPIGLIINELLTNSIKYAFKEKQTGLITVKLHKLNNKLELLIEDNGSGMDKNNSKTGFGHQLVKSMTRQLRAEYNLISIQGVKHVFSIPV